MRYFNGFSLQHEERFFDAFFIESEHCVSGFSYGAQQAFEYVYNSKKRIDRLILLSPAFFQTEKSSFLRTQLRYFEASNEAYVAQFLQNVAHPSSIDLSNYIDLANKKALESLLTYLWDEAKIREVLSRGTVIEVFLGENDKIIDSQKAFNFFTPLATTYFIKNTGHLLNQ